VRSFLHFADRLGDIVKIIRWFGYLQIGRRDNVISRIQDPAKKSASIFFLLLSTKNYQSNGGRDAAKDSDGSESLLGGRSCDAGGSRNGEDERDDRLYWPGDLPASRVR